MCMEEITQDDDLRESGITGSEFDVKEYTDKVEKLYKEGLFTKRGVVEDWKD